MVRTLKALLSAILVTAMAGCSAFPFKNLVSPRAQAIAQAESVLNQTGARSLSGEVDWPASPSGTPKTQALASNVISQATIALIDLTSGYTEATTLSDDTGAFNLNIPGFTPVASPDAYILEAVKGANSQSPGSGTLRLRTIVQWNGSGWVSCTNASPGTGAIGISGLTTALAIEVGLGRAAANEVIGVANNSNPPGLLVSPLNPNPPFAYGASPNCGSGCPTIAGSEIVNLETDVNDYVLDNLDPVAQTSQILPAITALNPTTGIVGQVVAASGSGFVAVPGATSVSFGGVIAPIVAVTPNTVFFTVPSNALTGNVTVTTPLGTSNAAAFTIPNSSTVVITNFAPNPTSAGTTLSIGGQGFVVPASGNSVTFACTPSFSAYGQTCSAGGTITVTPLSGDAHSLGVQVPFIAISGPVQVSNTFGSSSNVYLSVSLTGTPVITSNGGFLATFPNEGVDNQDMYLNGLLFGRTAGTVTFTDSTGKTYAAVIRQWRDNQVRVTVPWQLAAGAATITLSNSSNLNASIGWTVLNGTVNYSSPIFVGAVTSQTGPDLLGVFSGDTLYLVGGGGSADVSTLTLGANGSPGILTSNVWTNLPFGIGGPDAHDNKNTWQGDRYWLFDESGTPNKAYMQFDQSGNYLGTTNIIGPAFAIWNGATFFEHDTAIAGGNKGIYMLGADESTTPVYNNLMWELFNPNVDSIGPWNGMSSFAGEDHSSIVLGNNLWIFGGSGTLSASSPIDQNGNPTGAVNWGTDANGGDYAWLEPIGTTFYEQDWSSNVLRWDPLISGSYPRDFTSGTGWATASVSTSDCDNTSVVIGAYLYVIGDGGCTANGDIYAYPIS